MSDMHSSEMTPASTTARDRDETENTFPDTIVATRQEGVVEAEKVVSVEFCVWPHAELAASLSMLEFGKRLQLDELSMVGCGLEAAATARTGVHDKSREAFEDAVDELPVLTTDVTKSSQTSLRSFRSSSSCSFACRCARGIERQHIMNMRRGSTTALHGPPSRIPVLCRNKSSGSSWSFACQSARHVERKHEAAGEGDGASSFGSLSGWTNTDLDALPAWSEVEDDPEYNVPHVRDADMWSVTSKASSLAAVDVKDK